MYTYSFICNYIDGKRISELSANLKYISNLSVLDLSCTNINMYIIILEMKEFLNYLINSATYQNYQN